MVDIESGKADVVATGEAGNVMGAQFSPDGKWISYARKDRQVRSHVRIRNLENGDENMIVSDQFQVVSDAKWTPDERKLLLLGGVSVSSIASLSNTK